MPTSPPRRRHATPVRRPWVARLSVLLLLAFLALEILGRCCCLPAPQPQESCHGGHAPSAPVSQDDGCACELHAVAVDLERSSGAAAAPVAEAATALPLLAVLKPARLRPADPERHFRDLPPPDPVAAPSGLRAPPRS